jgi:hypothetical protein
MKKILLLIAGFVALYAFLNTGNTSTTNDVGQTGTSKYSTPAKNQFLNSPKTAPVLVPLPSQQKSSKGTSGNWLGIPKDTSAPYSHSSSTDKSDTSANTAPTQPSPSQDTSQTNCTPDQSTTCTTPTTTDQSNAGTTGSGTSSGSCNLSDPNVPIEQFQQNGTIICP